MNNEQIYKTIMDKMDIILPNEWSKLVIGANIENNSYEIFFYIYNTNDEKPISGYDLPGVEEDEIDDLMDYIYEILMLQLKELSDKGKELWKTITIVLDRNSIVDIEYGYNSIEDMYAYKTIWKYKYLNIQPIENESYANKVLNDYKKQYI